MKRLSSRGFTILEVLIALLIFSLGVLGLAGLLALSVQTNHSAYLRTQAAFLAQGIADRMRANASWALWTNLYNGTWSAPAAAVDCETVACNYDDIAKRDIAVWTSQIARFLPNATESITCTANTAAVPSSLYSQLPPFSGTCNVTISWSEANVDNQAGSNSPNTQTFAAVFQP